VHDSLRNGSVRERSERLVVGILGGGAGDPCAFRDGHSKLTRAPRDLDLRRTQADRVAGSQEARALHRLVVDQDGLVRGGRPQMNAPLEAREDGGPVHVADAADEERVPRGAADLERQVRIRVACHAPA
jgi:hypothetical protein